MMSDALLSDKTNSSFILHSEKIPNLNIQGFYIFRTVSYHCLIIVSTVVEICDCSIKLCRHFKEYFCGGFLNVSILLHVPTLLRLVWHIWFNL